MTGSRSRRHLNAVALETTTSANALSSPDTEALLSMLRRGLLLSLESLDPGVFEMKLKSILDSAGDCADTVFVSALDKQGRTALHIAVETEFIEAVKLLVETGRVDLLATAGDADWTPLHTAVDRGSVSLIRALLHPPVCARATLTTRKVFASLKQTTHSPIGSTALHMAVRRNTTACVVALLEAANDILRNQESLSEEEEEAAEGFFGEAEKQQHGNEPQGQAGCGSRKLNRLKDNNGDTALHWAVKTSNYTIARILCSYGARPRYARNHQGQTPLQLAEFVHRNSKMTALLSSFSRLPQNADPPTRTRKMTEKSTSTTASTSVADGSSAASVQIRVPGIIAAMERQLLLPILPAENGQRPCKRNAYVEVGPVEDVSVAPEVEERDAEASGLIARPYFHRESKTSNRKNNLGFGMDLDILEPSRPRSVSLKICRRDLQILRRKYPTLPRSTFLSKGTRESEKSRLASLRLPGATTPGPPLLTEQIPTQSAHPRPVTLRSRRRASTMDPEEYYPMASKRRGICIIINNMTYWHPMFKDRGGCDLDEQRTEKVFRELGFLVKVLRNLSSGEMHSQLMYIGQKTDHTTYDCFVAVVMSHGGLGEIYGVNGDAFPVHRLTYDFTAEKCPSLAGKPKLFFIQACRGDEYQLGYVLPVRANQSISTIPEPDNSRLQSPQPNPLTVGSGQKDNEDEPAIAAAKIPRFPRLVPSFTDFLLSYATLAGYKAQRDPKKGSVYIQTLCHHLETHGRTRSLLDIVTVVHREVSERVFREADSPQDEGTIFQQTPEVRHTLTRRVQFV